MQPVLTSVRAGGPSELAMAQPMETQALELSRVRMVALRKRSLLQLLPTLVVNQSYLVVSLPLALI